MSELFALSFDLHIFFAKFLGFLMLLHLGFVWAFDYEKFSYFKRLMLFLPFYYLIISFVFFTGVLLWALRNFAFDFTIFAMIFAFLSFIGLGAAGFKRLKIARITKQITKFRLFMSAKIAIEIVILGLTIFIGVKF